MLLKYVSFQFYLRPQRGMDSWNSSPKYPESGPKNAPALYTRGEVGTELTGRLLGAQ